MGILKKFSIYNYICFRGLTMSGMRRGDRRDSNIDNELKNPRSQQQEPLSYHELKQQRDNARGDRYLLQQENVKLQQELQQTLCLYNEEKERAVELLSKYKETDAKHVRYLTLYNEAQTQLKFEKSSKASIKGWETRRKLENERLKQQISDMVVLLRESLERQEENINHLYLMGERMDKIQRLMTSAELELSQNPVLLLEKLMRVWLLVQKILTE